MRAVPWVTCAPGAGRRYLSVSHKLIGSDHLFGEPMRHDGMRKRGKVAVFALEPLECDNPRRNQEKHGADPEAWKQGPGRRRALIATKNAGSALTKWRTLLPWLLRRKECVGAVPRVIPDPRRSTSMHSRHSATSALPEKELRVRGTRSAGDLSWGDWPRATTRDHLGSDSM